MDEPGTRCGNGSSLRGSNADRTAHACAAEAAIAHGILRQILLVVVLGKIELRRIEDFGGDRTEAPRLELLAIHGLRCLRGSALLGAEGVDAGAILRAHIVALAHALGRIVALPKRFEQPLIGNLLRIIDHEHHLVVPGATGANLLVSGIGRIAAGIADRGDVDALTQFPEFALGAPKAAHPEHGRFRSEEHTSELQSQSNLVCRLLLEKKKYTV